MQRDFLKIYIDSTCVIVRAPGPPEALNLQGSTAPPAPHDEASAEHSASAVPEALTASAAAEQREPPQEPAPVPVPHAALEAAPVQDAVMLGVETPTLPPLPDPRLGDETPPLPQPSIAIPLPDPMFGEETPPLLQPSIAVRGTAGLGRSRQPLRAEASRSRSRSRGRDGSRSRSLPTLEVEAASTMAPDEEAMLEVEAASTMTPAQEADETADAWAQRVIREARVPSKAKSQGGPSRRLPSRSQRRRRLPSTAKSQGGPQVVPSRRGNIPSTAGPVPAPVLLPHPPKFPPPAAVGAPTRPVPPMPVGGITPPDPPPGFPPPPPVGSMPPMLPAFHMPPPPPPVPAWALLAHQHQFPQLTSDELWMQAARSAMAEIEMERSFGLR